MQRHAGGQVPRCMAFFEDSTVKILIISGFLGAGKTTFIQALASRTGRDFAVYENELGQRNVDGEALRREELSIWESTENCVCCTGQADLASAVLTISNALDPEYLVVEPSGAARLSGVLEAIGRVCYDRISLLRPITLVDSRSFASQRRSAQELWEDQVRAAGTILCTKGESLLPEEQARLAALLARRNPKAEIFTQPYSQGGAASVRALRLVRPRPARRSGGGVPSGGGDGAAHPGKSPPAIPGPSVSSAGRHGPR